MDFVRIMRFRANESQERLYQSVLSRFINGLEPKHRQSGKKGLDRLIGKNGCVVEMYPSWHPILLPEPGGRMTITPHDNYPGLDHTFFLQHAFVTCPYHGAEDIVKEVQKVEPHEKVEISAEILDFPLYRESATPVLIKCTWRDPLQKEKMIPSALAIPMMLEIDLPNWKTAEVAETWETMRPHLLGQPCGSRSSLFVDQKTGQALKDMWTLLMDSGAFGPYAYRT
jgi:hypothetical protein